MKVTFKTGSILLINITLIGCVSTSWMKPGSGEEDLNKQQISCQAEAIQEFPPRMIADSENVTESSSDKCTNQHKHHKRKYCDNLQERYSMQYRDYNERARGIMVKECMYRNGWTEVQM